MKGRHTVQGEGLASRDAFQSSVRTARLSSAMTGGDKYYSAVGISERHLCTGSTPIVLAAVLGTDGGLRCLLHFPGRWS